MKLLALLALSACAPMTTLPALRVHDLDGAQVSIDSLRGPALVDLWATWCMPCARAMPFYAQLHQETGVRVVAISIDAGDEAVRAWLGRTRFEGLEILRDPDGEVAEKLGLRRMPTAFLLDAQGRVVHRYEGFREEDEPAIERDVRALLR